MPPLRCLLPLLLSTTVHAGTVDVAVASNFTAPLAELAADFEQRTGHRVRSSPASTGVLYAGIRNGAGYAVFLAADDVRPRLLEEAGIAVPGSRFTYALGRLELWSVDPDLEGRDCRAVLEAPGRRRVAIANPATAPYGAAAREFLQNAGLWDALQDNLVYGQNIAQTLQFVVTRNASLGLIAGSQAHSEALPRPTCRWPVPASLHPPIAQQAVLLESAAGNAAAAAFLDFLRSPQGRDIIRAHGYEVPD